MKKRLFLNLFTIICLCGIRGGVKAKAFCVATGLELENTLGDAMSNGEPDIIKIQQGRYNGHFSFKSNEDTSITLMIDFHHLNSCRFSNVLS